jgi:superkiller protein 3
LIPVLGVGGVVWWMRKRGFWKSAEQNDLDRAAKYYDRGVALLQAGQLDRATLDLKLALELNPQMASAYCQLGHLFSRKQDYQEAINNYLRAERLNHNLADIEKSLLVAQLNFGKKLLKEERTEEAIVQFQKAFSVKESADASAQLYYQLGLAQMQQKAWVQAVAEFQSALTHDPQMAFAHVGAGMALTQKGDLEAAIESFWAALGINPSMTEAHHHMGIALFKKGQLKAAIAAYRTALEGNDQSYPDLHVDLGLALVQAGELPEAKQRFSRVIKEWPHHAKAYLGLGHVSVGEGSYEKAVALYDKALDLNPKLYAALAAIGLTFLAQKQRDAAGKKFIHSRQAEAASGKFEMALRFDPSVAEAHFGMGEIYRIKGNLLFAQQSYQAALKVQGSYPAAHYRLGTVYARQGRLDLALEAFRTTLQLHPTYPEAAESLNRILSKQLAETSTELMPW